MQIIGSQPSYPSRYPDGDPRHLDCFIALYRAIQKYTIPIVSVLTWVFMRETAKIPLEDMEKLFEARNRDILLYQVKIVWPYLFKKYIFWQNVVLEPFDESRYGTSAIALV